MHVDFGGERTETIAVSVPVVETGEAVGIKEGGVVEHHLRELQVEYFHQDVPDQIEVDITNVELGGTIHVSDFVRPRRHDPHQPRGRRVSIITPAVLRVEADLSVPGEEGVEAVAPEEAEGEEGEEGAEAPAEGEGAEAPAAEEGGES